MKATEDLKKHLRANQMVTIPFVVVIYDNQDTDWHPVALCKTISEAVEAVKDYLGLYDPKEIWDIRQDVQMPLGEVLLSIK